VFQANNGTQADQKAAEDGPRPLFLRVGRTLRMIDRRNPI
jgi:hypothetical protein